MPDDRASDDRASDDGVSGDRGARLARHLDAG